MKRLWIATILLLALWAPDEARGQASLSGLAGRFEMEWAALNVPSSSDAPDIATGTVPVTIEQSTGACPPTSQWMILNPPFAGSVWCFRDDGSVDGSVGTMIGGLQPYRPNAEGGFDTFLFMAEFGSRGEDDGWGVGRRVPAATTPPPTPPPAPPPSGTISVIITEARVASGRLWVTTWIENAPAGTNTYVLSVDGAQRATTQSTSKGPVSTSAAPIASGTHTLTVTVANGSASGTASKSVVAP